MSRTRAAAVVVVLFVAGGVGGCPSRSSDARELAVSSDARARVVVDGALTELAAGQLDTVLARFCDQSAAGLRRARALLSPGLGRRDVVIRRIEPAWVGRDPSFFVEIGSADGVFVHGLGVEVRTGCLERAVGAADIDAGVIGDATAGADAGSLAP
jgi:hypothetical protein